MNTIILGPAHPLRPGGITTFNERLCRAIISAGHSCTIWSFSLQYPSFLFPGSSQYTDQPAPANTPIIPKINSVNPVNWIKAGQQLNREKPDLIIVRFWIPFMGPCLGTILRLAKRNRHTRIVCIADNIVPHEKRIGDSLFTRYFVKPVDNFVVMSQQVLDDLRGFTQKPAKLLPHPLYDNFGEAVGVNEARKFLAQSKNIAIEAGTLLLVFFGLVRYYKGLDLLIEAMGKIQNKDVKLLVAGEFYEEEQLFRQQIDKAGLQDRIILYNQFIPGEEVKYFICAADCIIQPYRSATQSGVTPVAYHFEVPMIVTRVGGLPQMVPHELAGLVCEPTPPDLAVTIDRYFEMGKDGFLPGLQAEKVKFSWDIFAEEVLKVN